MESQTNHNSLFLLAIIPRWIYYKLLEDTQSACQMRTLYL